MQASAQSAGRCLRRRPRAAPQRHGNCYGWGLGNPPPGMPRLPHAPQAFLEYYYGLFGSNRQGLASLYQDQSMFTFEGAKCQGPAAIMAKLTSLPFQAVRTGAQAPWRICMRSDAAPAARRAVRAERPGARLPPHCPGAPSPRPLPGRSQCKITPASMDFQPSISGGIIVFVTGHVQVRPPAPGGRPAQITRVCRTWMATRGMPAALPARARHAGTNPWGRLRHRARL